MKKQWLNSEHHYRRSNPKNYQLNVSILSRYSKYANPFFGNKLLQDFKYSISNTRTNCVRNQIFNIRCATPEHLNYFNGYRN